MWNRKTHKTTTKALLMGVALAALLATGCSSSSTQTTWAEPDPAEALVLDGPGLSACDALGQRVFVDEGYRVATAQSVFQMAAAEDPNLSLDGIVFDAAPTATTPKQVIVYGSQPIDEQAPTATVEVPTNYFE